MPFRLHLVRQRPLGQHPADEDAGEDRDDRHQDAARREVEEVQELKLADRDVCPGAIAERGERRQEADERAGEERGGLALDLQEVAERGDAGFVERDGRSRGREDDEREEREAEPCAGASEHGEHLRQRDEHQSRTLTHRLLDGRSRLHGEEVDDRDDHKARDDCDERIEDLDAADAPLDRIRLLHIRAVRHHNAHRQRERIEHLAHRAENRLAERGERELPFGVAQAVEVRQQVVADARPGPRQAHDVDRDADREDEQERHEDEVRFLDAVLDAEDDDRRAAEDEEDAVAERRERRGDEAREELRGVHSLGSHQFCSRKGHLRVGGEILDHPAADDAVVRDDQDRDDRREETEEAPPAVELRVGRQLALLGLAPDGNLGQHQREAERRHQDQVDEEEGSAAVLGREIRETPEVSETNRRRRGRQHEGERPGPTCTFFAHGVYCIRN